jgi:hypothetical protein
MGVLDVTQDQWLDIISHMINAVQEYSSLVRCKKSLRCSASLSALESVDHVCLRGGSNYGGISRPKT